MNIQEIMVEQLSEPQLLYLMREKFKLYRNSQKSFDMKEAQDLLSRYSSAKRGFFDPLVFSCQDKKFLVFKVNPENFSSKEEKVTFLEDLARLKEMDIEVTNNHFNILEDLEYTSSNNGTMVLLRVFQI